ncbi:MAG: flagellar M-ring protein FliF [Pseudomonadota bacterium]|nr:flagellar M-ring protein FliF [Pseudomonadota bacterium]
MADTADLPVPTDAPKASIIADVMNSPKLGAFMTILAVLALVAAAWMWNQQPDMKVLYGNLSDRDGGTIIAALQQMNIPYKFTDGGAILVPGPRVHEARLQLAAQGLPKGGTVGFEVMESQKLGTSQFQEQVNYQRGLEGELARTIQSLAAVESARVHLGLSKPSVFLKDQQKPSASVLVNLRGGHTLDRGQVSAIIHLVSNSVPDLPTKNVSVVDQQGNLLSDPPKDNDGLLDEDQLKYVREVEQKLRQRVESILTPVLGADNVRAEITAELDFTRGERANETYKPNQDPTAAAVRSTQVSQSSNRDGNKDGGVPGALSNQPPADAKAPLSNGKPGAAAAAGQPATPTSESKDATTNYEVDKQIDYVQRPAGSVKRLSVAVVVNNKRVVDAKGVVTQRALNDAEKAQLLELVQNAVGFDKARGDVVNVVNTPFSPALIEAPGPTLPIWKNPEYIEMAKDAARYLLLALGAAYLWFGWLRPAFRRINGQEEAAKSAAERAEKTGREVLSGEESELQALGQSPEMAALTAQEQAGQSAPDLLLNDINTLRSMAKSDPKLMAAVVRGWVNE